MKSISFPVIVAFFLLVLPLQISAQTSYYAQRIAALKADPAIGWVAGYDAEYNFDLQTAGVDLAFFKLIFAQQQFGLNASGYMGMVPGMYFMPLSENWRLLDESPSIKGNIYDDTFTTPLQGMDLETTISNAFSWIEKDGPMMIRNPIGPDQVKQIQARHLLYYDTKSEALRIEIVGVRPIFSIWKDNATQKGPANFWIIPGSWDRNRDFYSDNKIEFVATTKNMSPAFDSMQIIKMGKFSLKAWALRILEKPDSSLLNSEYRPSVPSEDQDAGSEAVDSEQYAFVLDEFGVINTEIGQIDHAQFNRASFTTHWFFEKQADGFFKIYCDPVAVRPMAPVRNTEGKLLYLKPVFVKRL
ncbi:MAG: hypothetical protein IPL65_10665 [Lewinellaceae bacterium]|nr:hypothetical protein [Lewinellaceae bacterium]